MGQMQYSIGQVKRLDSTPDSTPWTSLSYYGRIITIKFLEITTGGICYPMAGAACPCLEGVLC